MKWNALKTEEQLIQIKNESKQNKILIFKHSTRCNISRTTLDRLERNWKDDELNEIKLYFLDLISYRNISNLIASEFQVEHESPQVLIIDNEQAIYDRSHFEIDYHQIKTILKN